MSVTYTSTTGKPVIVGSYIIGVSPGLSLGNAVDELDVLVGISLNRTNTTALELKSNLQEIVNVIPVIIPNSSTVATNGAITLAALPNTYALEAWVYLPAGAIVGGAAGFYWTVFSGGAGVGIVKTNYVDPSATEFLPYVPTGILTTAVGSNSTYVTPTASDIALINITLPANTVSVGSALKAFCRVTCSNGADAKTVKHLLGSTTIGSQAFTTSTGGTLTTATFSRTNAKQIMGTFGDSGIAATTFGTVNTAAASKFVITGQLAAITGYIVLEAFTVSQTFN